MIRCTLKRRVGPTKFLYQVLVGKYGMMPNICVYYGDWEYTRARLMSVSTISGNGGLNQIALPLI
jgi:hypothetical protein